MVYASSARPRSPRPACKSCRKRPTVSSAPKNSSVGKGAANGTSSTKAAAPQTAVAPRDIRLPVNRYLVYFGLATVGCAADLYSKQAVFRWRGLPRPDNEWWIFDGHFGIETSVNPGALFGMGAGWWWFFALCSVVALIAINVWLFLFGAACDRWITV